MNRFPCSQFFEQFQQCVIKRFHDRTEPQVFVHNNQLTYYSLELAIQDEMAEMKEADLINVCAEQFERGKLVISIELRVLGESPSKHKLIEALVPLFFIGNNPDVSDMKIRNKLMNLCRPALEKLAHRSILDRRDTVLHEERKRKNRLAEVMTILKVPEPA